MEKEMEKEKNIFWEINYYLKENILMVIKIKKGKNILGMEN